MKQILQPISNLLRFHKLKILVFLAMTAVFFVVFFPYDDLGDWVAAKVSEMTQRQVYLQFEGMGFSLYPQPGIEFEKVYMESTFAPSLRIGALSMAPSIRGLLSFKPGVTILAQDFLKGNVHLSTRGGEKTAKGERKQILQLQLEKVLLGEVLKLIEAPVDLNGAIKGESQFTVDPNFSEQPDGKIDITVDRFRLPPSSVATPIGPLNLPEITISSIRLQGRLISGELFVDELRLGDSKDELNGTVKGQLQVTLVKRGVEIAPQFGRYDFKIDLRTLPSLEKKAGLFLTFLDSYKKPQIAGSRYSVQISGTNFYNPPRIQNLPD